MALALLVLVWHLAWAQEPGCAEKDEQSFLQTLDILDHVEEEACDLLHPKKGLRWTHSKQTLATFQDCFFWMMDVLLFLILVRLTQLLDV